MGNFSDVSKILIGWYEIHQRVLPWRNTDDPYKIWISEVILQQTRVVQGLDYYKRFIGRFPDIDALAAADEQEVLKYWQGLGYYSRARNLHEAARYLKQLHGGKFPADYKTIRSLKGVGDYTAAAIVSFAYNMPYPVVDGNVLRFLSRLFAIDDPIDLPKGKAFFTALAGDIMDELRPGLFNQAIMEFGALQCTPSSPACGQCPFLSVCLAYATDKVSDYPVKIKKLQVGNRYLYYFHIHYQDYVYLKKREGKGIWQNLYEFPMIESEFAMTFEELIRHKNFRELFPSADISKFKLVIQDKKHTLTHLTLYADFFEVTINEESESLLKVRKIRQNAVDEFPTHRLMQLYWETITKKT
ncbi:MAG: A/G-specific adenine glycosylase [Dysgonamonadaceae bacterium]|jgi:A/G-specific adenine glycosylase|nr:A/G-specific adenine glycosylase [Dysgonamonadaceae bacterium]